MAQIQDTLNVSGTTQLRALTLTDFVANGSIGSAATTVDIYSAIYLNQTTAGISLTIPNPTITANASPVYVSNIGSTSVMVQGATLNAGSTFVVVWNGSTFTPVSATVNSSSVVFRPAVQAMDSVDTVKPTVNPVIDGYTVQLGDRVLFTNLTTGNNEVYLATSALVLVVWTLQTDGQAGTGVPTNGDTLFVQFGTAHSNQLWSYGGTTWNQVSSLNAVWIYNGNVVGVTTSLGTVDNVALPIITNSITRYTVAAGAATLTSTGNGLITTDTGSTMTVKSLDSGAATFDSGTTGGVNIGTGANAKTIIIGNATGATTTAINSGTGGVSLITTSNGAIDLLAGATGVITIQAGTTSGAVNINTSSTNPRTVNIATGTNGNTINVGTGANTAAQSVNIASGAAAATSTVNILTGIASAGTQTLNLATNASAKTVNIGNITAATAVNVLTGTGNFLLDGVGASTYAVGPSTTGGTITIGGTAQTGAIILGSSTGTNTVALAAGSGAATVAIANTTVNASTINALNGINTGSFAFNLITGATAANADVNILTGTGTAGTATLRLANNPRVTTVDILNVAPASAGTTVNIATGNNAVNTNINIGTGTQTAGATTVSIGGNTNFSLVRVRGSETRDFVTVSTTGNIALGTRYDMNTGTVTRTLPAPTGNGRIVTVKNVGTGTITVNTLDASTIDTGTSFAAASVSLTSDVSQDFIDYGSWQRI